MAPEAPSWDVGGAVRIRRLTVGPYRNNVYVVACPQTGDAVLIDAADQPERILAALTDVHLVAILTTHGHPDHWQALAAVRAAHPGAVARVHAADAGMLPPPPLADGLEDGGAVEFGSVTLTVLHTPGHTPGSICLYLPGHLFSGDTLFPGGPGATRPPLGDFPTIIASVGERLFTLPDDTVVHPGHGEQTTIGVERPHLGEWIARGW
ncbi:MAG TPA: MBL fold metallo-hydrolase [Candidatus Micrarchaeia archaeon]|nr:MBL fold metallo-hydrolase [Candidatus Micrarchaeia archaeon]